MTKSNSPSTPQIYHHTPHRQMYQLKFDIPRYLSWVAIFPSSGFVLKEERLMESWHCADGWIPKTASVANLREVENFWVWVYIDIFNRSFDIRDQPYSKAFLTRSIALSVNILNGVEFEDAHRWQKIVDSHKCPFLLGKDVEWTRQRVLRRLTELPLRR